MTPEPTTRHASCLCKKVRFDLTGDPFHYVVCHCKNCQKVRGSAFSTNAMFKLPQFKITHGVDFIQDYLDSDTLSGNAISRSFCRSCGSPLFIRPAKGDFVITCPGLIDEKVNWIPKKEGFTQDQCSWVKELTFQVKRPSKLW